MPAQAFVVVAVEDRTRHEAGDRRARLEIPIDGVKQMRGSQFKVQERLTGWPNAVKLGPCGQKGAVGIISQAAHRQPWRVGHQPVELAGEKAGPVSVSQDEGPDAIPVGECKCDHALDQRMYPDGESFAEILWQRRSRRGGGTGQKLHGVRFGDRRRLPGLLSRNRFVVRPINDPVEQITISRLHESRRKLYRRAVQRQVDRVVRAEEREGRRNGRHREQ
jgi:hypothetical protein